MRGYYNVFKTDYTNYSIVFSIKHHLLGAPTKNVWILHRELNPPKEEVDRLMEQACQAFQMKPEDFLWTKKSDQ